MTDADLLDFTHKFRQVRRFSARRVYLTPKEVLDLLMQHRHVMLGASSPGKDFMFDGAFVRRLHNPAVCSAIREWDLLPYGE